MKAFISMLVGFIILFVSGAAALYVVSAEPAGRSGIQAEPNASAAISIQRWQYQWLSLPESKSISSIEAIELAKAASAPTADTGKWISADAEHPMQSRPEGVKAALIRFKLPQLDWPQPALSIERLYGTAAVFMIEGHQQPMYAFERDYEYDTNYLLLPLTQADSGRWMTVLVQSNGARLALKPEVTVDDYAKLQTGYEKYRLIDLVYGGAFFLLALVMMACLFVLKRWQFKLWLTMCCIILCIGTLVIAYSTALHHHYGTYGAFFYSAFEFASALLLPSFTYFFEQLWGAGRFGAIRKLRKAQVLFALLDIILWGLAHSLLPELNLRLLIIPFALMVIVQFVVLSVHAIAHAIRGSRDALIIAIGFSAAAVCSITEMVMFTYDDTYMLTWWKWGLLCFVISLIVAMGRQFSRSHDKLVEYTMELDVLNREFQRSEKMEVISQLAASIAHEVRNPLQVTRGFLQLIEEQSAADRERRYLAMAVQELDRASGIITEFLSFAKPEMNEVTLLCISDELHQIYGMLMPHAAMQEAQLDLAVDPALYAIGDAAKFKQAFINMVKNSMEALTGDNPGWVRISAHKRDRSIVIRITDNGEGIEQEALQRLGEPYFTSKSSGTGLGLMVTFRIIEAMEGTLQFRSTRGEGTEAEILLPAVEPGSRPESGMSR